MRHAETTHIPAEQLSSRIDGELSAEASRVVDDHLGSCELCRKAAAEMSEIDELFRSAEVPELSPRVWRRVAGQLDDALSPKPGHRWLGWLRLGQLSLPNARRLAWSAASAVLLAAVVIQQWSVRRTEMVRLTEIDRARTVLIAQFSETENPFRLTASNRELNENPFNLRPLDRGINPFQASTAR